MFIFLSKRRKKIENLDFERGFEIVNVDENGAIGFWSEGVLFNTYRMFKVCGVCCRRQQLLVGAVARHHSLDSHAQRDIFI